KEIIDHFFLSGAKLFNSVIELVKLFFIHLLVNKELFVREGETEGVAFFQLLSSVQPLRCLPVELSFEALKKIKFNRIRFVGAGSVVFQVDKNLLNGILH